MGLLGVADAGLGNTGLRRMKILFLVEAANLYLLERSSLSLLRTCM